MASGILEVEVQVTNVISRRTVRFNKWTPHVTHEQELKNRMILREIGASENQVKALSHRTFSTLPLWARYRLKRQLRGDIRLVQPKKDLPKPYFFPRLSPEEQRRFEAAYPKGARRFAWERETTEGTGRLIRVVC